jgi:hypothetical protein
MKKTERAIVTVDRDLHSKIKVIAVKNGIQLKDLMDEIIRVFLEKANGNP